MRWTLALLFCIAFPLHAQQSSAPIEANKALVRRAFAAMNRGDVEALNQIFDPKGPVHSSRGVTALQGGPFTELKDSCPMCAALHDRKISIDFLLADGDMVAVRSTWSGIYIGKTHGVAIAGKPVSVVYINFYRIANGRIVENWFQSDSLHLAEQLGFKLASPQ